MPVKREYEFLLSIIALIFIITSIFTWSWEFTVVFIAIMAFLIALLLKA
jgi:uncharacterized membrane protein